MHLPSVESADSSLSHPSSFKSRRLSPASLPNADHISWRVHYVIVDQAGHLAINLLLANGEVNGIAESFAVRDLFFETLVMPR